MSDASMIEDRSFDVAFTHDGQKFSFDTRAELIAFLSDTKSINNWLQQQQTNSNAYHQYRSAIFEGLDNIILLIENMGINDQFVNSQIIELLANYKVPLPSTPFAEFIDIVRAKHGDAVALGVIAARSEIAIDYSRGAFARGMSLLSMYEEGMTSDYLLSQQNSFAREHERLRTILAALERDRHRMNETLRDQIDYNSKSSSSANMRLMRIARRLYRKRLSKHTAIIVGLENTQKSYREQMRLKAPVEYWSDKAKKHREKSENYRQELIYWGIRVGSAVFVMLCFIAWVTHAWASASAPIGSFIGPATIGVLITTIAFWAARILVRLYMSEHHLSIDAEERAIMVQTYLALIEAGAATETERALVLAPLFKSSSDGIVKDDAAPDLSPASLFSKALSKP